MRWERKGAEFDRAAEVICREDRPVYIWGAGVFGVSVMEILRGEMDIAGFIDSNPEKQGSEIRGARVYPPRRLEDGGAKVVVATGWIRQVYGELDRMGYVPNRDYFHANDFIAVYMLYGKGRVYAMSANTAVTTKCSLRCEKCMGLIPYSKNPRNLPREEILGELEAYFNWVDYLAVLGLGGGDVLMHPEFADILEEVCARYWKKKVQDVEIYTNAIIMPSERLLEIFRRYDVVVRFSDYSRTLPGRQKIGEMTRLLESRGIRCDRAVWESWYDTGFPQESNGIEEEAALREHYRACLTKMCAVLVNKKLYACSLQASAVLAGISGEHKGDYFDLADFDPGRKKEFIEFCAGYNEKGYLSWCRRCNGYQNTNDHLIQVAKQIESGGRAT